MFRILNRIGYSQHFNGINKMIIYEINKMKTVERIARLQLGVLNHF